MSQPRVRWVRKTGHRYGLHDRVTGQWVTVHKGKPILSVTRKEKLKGIRDELEYEARPDLISDPEPNERRFVVKRIV